jgi:glucose/arabinose dehydrogenase
MLPSSLPIVLALGCAEPAAAPPRVEESGPVPGEVHLEQVASGLRRPVGLVASGDGSGRLFVVGQRGTIHVLAAGGALSPEPFLDLSDRVSCCGERGLLGLAFHPRFRDNGAFFVDYTDRQGDTVISRFQVTADPDRADAASEQRILAFDQPFSNHNGGQLAFGPDGYLYVGTGDGGAAADPLGNGQSLATLLGKLLRLDVDRPPYGVPPDNPFVDRSGARSEIWAYGLRNPWRFSFDRATGDLWIGDVGQNRWEEIDLQPAASRGGENYGWDRMEGRHCFEPRLGCDEGGLVGPVLEYDHRQGCSVTGGFRYRGRVVPELDGLYLYGDYCRGTVWAGNQEGGRWRSRVLLETGLAIASFGEDEGGELYLVALGETDGSVHRFASASAAMR